MSLCFSLHSVPNCVLRESLLSAEGDSSSKRCDKLKS